MANPVYVRSGAGASSPGGTSWTDAFPTIAAATATAVTNGAPIWVSEDHSGVISAATTYTGGASQAAFLSILCVNHTTGTFATGAVEASAAGISLAFSGFGYCDGVTIQGGPGTGAGAANIALGLSSAAMGWTFANCRLVLGNTNTNSGIVLGQVGAFGYRVTLINTSMVFGVVGQVCTVYGVALAWKNTASPFGGGAIPTNLFSLQRLCSLAVEGVDLSAMGSGKTLINPAQPVTFRADFKDVIRSDAMTIFPSASPMPAGSRIGFVRAAAAAGSYYGEFYLPEGIEKAIMTTVLSGGASDGTTSRSEQIKASALAGFYNPFESREIAVWNDGTSAMTVALEGLWDQSALPANTDIGIEVEYLADANDPKGGFVTSLGSAATGVGAVSSSATWTGAPATNTKFRLVSPSFTPAQKGFLTIRIKVANATGTFVIDPKPVLSTGVVPSRTYTGASGTIINETGTVTQGPSVNVYVPVGGRRLFSR